MLHLVPIIHTGYLSDDEVYKAHREVIRSSGYVKKGHNINMQTHQCEVCGWDIYTNYEDSYQCYRGGPGCPTLYLHRFCHNSKRFGLPDKPNEVYQALTNPFGRQNRSRPNRPSATPRQKQ